MKSALAKLLPAFVSAKSPAKSEKRSLSWGSTSGWPEHFVRKKTLRGIAVTPKTSLGFSAVYSCVNLIACNIAGMKFNVHRRTDQGRMIDYDHDQQFLVSKEPNSFTSAFNFFRVLISFYLLWGNGYARMRRDRDYRPVSYEFRPSYYVTPKLLRNDLGEKELWYWDLETREMIPYTDMIHIADLGYSEIVGQSRISIAQESVSMALSSTQFGNDFFTEYTHLGGYVKTQDKIEDGGKRLRESFKEIYAQGDMGVLEEGAEFVPHKYPMPLRDAQFIDSRQFQVEEVCRFFNIPPSKVGHLGATPSYNNVEQANIQYVQSCLQPICTLVEQEFDRKSLRPSERKTHYFKKEINTLLRGDIKTRALWYKTMIEAGLMDRNEARALEDMNEVEGGKIITMPLNHIPLHMVEDYFNAKIKQLEK